MKRNQNDRNRNLEKPIPGCLGRMVNLFDLNTNVGGNKLLTNKPHYEGSPISRSQSDVSRTRTVDHINDKLIVSEIKKSTSNRKSNGTLIKTLIAHEMSKDEFPKQSPPNLVAKLMGLESLPQHVPTSRKTDPRGPRNRSGPLEPPRDHDDISGRFKDIYEIWQQQQLAGGKGERGRYKSQNKMEKNMDLVREKFMEAKRLSTDEKQRQSKQFQDALEVLSSNKDLFLKLLQEPNSLFSRPNDFQSVNPNPDSRRITVLRPSKLVDGHKLNKTSTTFLDESFNFNNHPPPQPTRIVVLKPSSVKPPQESRVVDSPPSSNDDDGFYADPEDSEPPESREVPKEGMFENRTNRRRDETLLSSVFFNGYIGDESSFSKSEVYYAAGNLSDSEVMSPISRHSWDYINRFGNSPYSSSSFSRASYSPESSVCREAKKRLSERWAMMSLNEQRHVRRSSSTLGEMLAISDLKKSKSAEESTKEICEIREDSKVGSTSYLTDDLDKNVVRSSSFSGEDFGIVKGKKEDLSKEKGVVKSSLFKGLFFSKSRKSSKTKSEELSGLRDVGNDGAESVKDVVVEESCQTSVDAGRGLPEGGFSLKKPETPNENPEQPSPISVLELQFEDDDHTAAYSRNAKLDQNDPVKYNLIDKSPPIGSVARTLLWDESTVGPTTYVSAKTSTSPQEEEQECFSYVQTLLSAAGFNDGSHQSNSWGPLDPSLRDTYMNVNPNEPPSPVVVVHLQAKQRHVRSTQRLVFDCVNEALIDFTGCNGVTVVDHVWARMKEWISGEGRCVWDCEDGSGTGGVAVERVVRREVVGEVWVEKLKMEIENIKMEIEEKLVEQVVEECVVQLLSRVVL